MTRVLIALALLAVIGCTTTGQRQLSDYKTGEQIPEAQNRWIFLEVLTVAQNELTDRIYRNEKNPVKDEKLKDRASQGITGPYKVTNRLARDLDILTGAENDEIPINYVKGCTFDIVIDDVDPQFFGKTVLLSKGHINTGTFMVPERVPGNNRAVQYKNVTIDRINTLVLPIGDHVWGAKPSMTFIAKNTRIRTPYSDDKTRKVYVGHRTDTKRGVNTAITVALAVDRCKSI